MEHPGLGIDAGNAVIWIIVWLVAAMVWSLIAVIRGMMKPARDRVACPCGRPDCFRAVRRR